MKSSCRLLSQEVRLALGLQRQRRSEQDLPISVTFIPDVSRHHAAPNQRLHFGLLVRVYQLDAHKRVLGHPPTLAFANVDPSASGLHVTGLLLPRLANLGDFQFFVVDIVPHPVLIELQIFPGAPLVHLGLPCFKSCSLSPS